MGEYQPGVDYIFDHNVAIIDGNLRIYCATKGVLGQVWTIIYNFNTLQSITNKSLRVQNLLQLKEYKCYRSVGTGRG